MHLFTLSIHYHINISLDPNIYMPIPIYLNGMLNSKYMY